MELVTQKLSKENAFGSNCGGVVIKSDASSTSSEYSSSWGCTAPPVMNCSDEEEVLLASNVPKKRAGRKVFKETRHPIYRGVRQRKNNRWVCELRMPDDKKTRLWLGTYPTAEMAARAHDVAALTLRGKAACVNFADSAWTLRLPASKDAHEIRKAAAEAAEVFGDSKSKAERWMKTQYNDEVSSGEITMEQAGALSPRDDSAYPIERGTDQFGMHGWPQDFLDGPLLSPTHCVHESMQCWNDVEMDANEVSLWNFST